MLHCRFSENILRPEARQSRGRHPLPGRRLGLAALGPHGLFSSCSFLLRLEANSRAGTQSPSLGAWRRGVTKGVSRAARLPKRQHHLVALEEVYEPAADFNRMVGSVRAGERVFAPALTVSPVLGQSQSEPIYSELGSRLQVSGHWESRCRPAKTAAPPGPQSPSPRVFK